MADETPEETAHELHHELLEVLKQLNRADVEETDVEGYEREEIFLVLRRGAVPELTDETLGKILDTLVANGYARRIEGATYAWDRARVVGARYTITLPGKEYLVSQLEHQGRVS